MSKNEEIIQTPLARKFFIASDEGDVDSSRVYSIRRLDEGRTCLVRREGREAYVDAPVDVVRDIFREHGHPVIDEKELARRTEEHKQAKPQGLG